MAFLRDNLQPIGGMGRAGPSPAVWSYKTEDVHAAVAAINYFDPVADILKVGDMIDVVVVASLGADPEVVSTYGRHIVLTNTAGVVDVSDVTIGDVTNT